MPIAAGTTGTALRTGLLTLLTSIELGVQSVRSASRDSDPALPLVPELDGVCKDSACNFHMGTAGTGLADALRAVLPVWTPWARAGPWAGC